MEKKPENITMEQNDNHENDDLLFLDKYFAEAIEHLSFALNHFKLDKNIELQSYTAAIIKNSTISE